MTPIISNDAVVLGILVTMLALIFHTSASVHPFWKKFYTYVPALLLCYFLPSVLNMSGLVDPDQSKLYFVASRYLLPTSIVLLTLSIDMKKVMHLGPKALIMFLTASAGIIIGGPIAILVISIFSPETVGGTGPDAVWRGMTTIAGSWIGGGANQTAMKEIFHVGDTIFSALLPIDVFVSTFWMAFLLYGAGMAPKIDKWLKSDTSSIDEIREKVEAYRMKIAKIPNLSDLTSVLAAGFGVTAIAHFGADLIAPWIQSHAPYLKAYSLTSNFFWLIVIATTGGLLLSFTKLRDLEGVGASRIGSFFLYVLVATIGLKMNILALVETPGIIFIAVIWMLVHVSLLILVAKLIRAPFFFLAVGSQANIGGAASAPIVASAFHPALAPVGVLLAVLGYALGTYGAWLCGIIMSMVAP
ncbi:MAG: DUF819 family protein [Deferribacteres bacterium]|nr:DUF819 family protein [candidate division KSB1 bacterium]MCB9503028.1 DUF819 family protein [Deferribacteres bacterium]